MTDKETIREAGRELLEHISDVMDKVNWPDLFKLVDMLPKVARTFVTGAGRSGLVARSFVMRLMHAGLRAYIPGETITPPATKGDLLVAISCTGQTGMTDYVANRGRKIGCQVVAITASPKSALAGHVHKVIHIPVALSDIVLRAAVFEHATSLCLDAVFNVLSDRLKIDAKAFQSRHANLE
ncbi:MAG: SIS domain-containing protein [Planctomycetes bacterium]|nr:SIS domain-containing protein [Planctomycetota bacterium]